MDLEGNYTAMWVVSPVSYDSANDEWFYGCSEGETLVDVFDMHVYV